jgi:hypothetical protein
LARYILSRAVAVAELSVRYGKGFWLTAGGSAVGYFHTGFVLTHQPNWERLNELPRRYSFRGYQHKNRQVWLLDLWQRQRLWQRMCKQRHHRFADRARAGDHFTTDPSWLPPETQIVLARLDQLAKALRPYAETYGPGWVRLTLEVSSRLGSPAYFFVADDELYDMGCRVRSGRIDALACRYGRFIVRHQGGRMSITPIRFEEDDEQDVLPASLLKMIQGLEGVDLLGTASAQDGLKLYQFPVELWPVEAGDPAETLGIGTWDPFENLDRDFTNVFARENGTAQA